MSPLKARAPTAITPPDGAHSAYLQSASGVTQSDEQLDRTTIAIRCVAAAEIYKHTGRLPVWAQPSGPTTRT